MVGTRPMRFPSWRCGWVAARKAATLRTTSIFSMDEASSGRPLHGAEDVVGARETPGSDISGIALRRRLDLIPKLGIALHEARLELGEKAEDVFGDQHLAVAGSRGAEADGRHGDTGGDRFGQLLHHAFDHDREGAGFGDGD